jgi:hypothetical protein
VNEWRFVCMQLGDWKAAPVIECCRCSRSSIQNGKVKVKFAAFAWWLSNSCRRDCPTSSQPFHIGSFNDIFFQINASIPIESIINSFFNLSYTTETFSSILIATAA